MIDSFGDVAPGYLDWARFGPLSPAVRAEMLADTEMLGTGRSASIDLVAARSAEARDLVAQVMGMPTDEVVLQPSTTHGLEHAFLGLTGTVVLPAQDFPAVRVTAARAAAARGLLAVREIDPPGGIVTPEDVAAALTDEVTAVALSLVDFRTGALADLTGIREVIGDRLLIVDAMQAFGVTDVEWAVADVIVGNGYKWLRAGRGTGFARFSPRARERIEPVLSGTSGMAGDASSPGVPQPLPGAAAYSVAPGDPLAASRLVAALREVIEAGVPAIAATVRERAHEVMQLADRFGLPVVTPRDAHAGIVSLSPDAADAPALSAALANHGLTVTARGGGIRVSTHVGGGCVGDLGDALADAAARRAVTIDLAPDLGAALPAAEVFTIELPEESSLDVPDGAPLDLPSDPPAEAGSPFPETGAVESAPEPVPAPEEAAPEEYIASSQDGGTGDAADGVPDDEVIIATVDDDLPVQDVPAEDVPAEDAPHDGDSHDGDPHDGELHDGFAHDGVDARDDEAHEGVTHDVHDGDARDGAADGDELAARHPDAVQN